MICSICAIFHGGDPNHATYDIVFHLSLEHRDPGGLDKPSRVLHVLRILCPSWGLVGPHTHWSNTHSTKSYTGRVFAFPSSDFPSRKEVIDGIAKLLSQSSGVRHSAGGQLNYSGPSTFQLEMWLLL